MTKHGPAVSITICIEREDEWAFRKVALFLSRIRYDDQGYGEITLVVQNSTVVSIKPMSVLKQNGGA